MAHRFLVLFVALSLPFASVQAEEGDVSFNAPKSDIGLELLLDFLEAVFNFDLQEIAAPRILKDEVIASNDQFESRKIELRTGRLGRINLYLKVPRATTPAPAVFLIPGLNTESTLLDRLGIQDPVVQAMIEYPFPKTVTKGKLIYEAIRKAIVLQLQTAAVLNWLNDQDFVESSRISVVSVSYGTFLAPFALRLAQILGFDPYALVFAYGGSDLKSLVLPELENAMSSADFDNIQKPLAKFLDATSPSQHLPHLQTQTGYLVVSGVKDEVIPSDSTNVLLERLPDPTESIKLDTGHIGMNRPETTQKAFSAVYEWLKKQGAF